MQKALLTDPQTSGGLLVACAPDAEREVMEIVRPRRFRAGGGDRTACQRQRHRREG